MVHISNLVIEVNDNLPNIFELVMEVMNVVHGREVMHHLPTF